jgi:starch synthase
MATPGVGAACLAPSAAAAPPRRRADPARASLHARPRLVRRRCVAELSREGPASRPLHSPANQLAPPLVPGFLAPPAPAPAQAPAPTPTTVPDGGLGEPEPEFQLQGTRFILRSRKIVYTAFAQTMRSFRRFFP